MMAPVTLHGDAAPGEPGGLDAAPIPGLSCSVWIVGSSIVRNAGIAALSRPGGQCLGLQTKGIDIWWQGYEGLRFVDLACKLRW